MTFRDLALAEIERNPDQPRKHFDEEALDELAASIRASGLLQPIVVRPVEGRFVIVAGERRWRAAQRAGLDRLPVNVVELDEAEAYVLSVAENVARRDMTVIEEAEAYGQLLAFGKTKEDIGRLFGKSKQYVESRLSLLSLVPEIASHVGTGAIGPAAAYQVSVCNEANQRVCLTKWMRGDFTTERELIHFAYALKQAEAQDSMFVVEEVTEEEREERAFNRRRALSHIEQAERLAQRLNELADMGASDLSKALEGQVGKYAAALDRVADALAKARFEVRQAKALAEARVIVVEGKAVS